VDYRSVNERSELVLLAQRAVGVAPATQAPTSAPAADPRMREGLHRAAFPSAASAGHGSIAQSHPPAAAAAAAAAAASVGGRADDEETVAPMTSSRHSRFDAAHTGGARRSSRSTSRQPASRGSSATRQPSTTGPVVDTASNLNAYLERQRLEHQQQMEAAMQRQQK
jgi:hypothetical protein